MRPLELTLEGFRSYQDATRLDLSRRNLVAIVGPMGSGKSSILDAMSYALYAKTSRVKKGITRLVSSRCEEAHVRLVFEVDGHKWQVTRSLTRRSSGGQHVLEDLASGDKTIGATEVNGKVEEILGLDFDAFCSSVLLAQGQFSRFLDAATTERMKILKGVFRYDQIDELRVAAKGRISGLELHLAEIEGERKGFPDDPRGDLKAARAQEKESRARTDTLEKALPRAKALQGALDEATRSVDEIEESARRALDALQRIPAEEEFAAIAAEERAVEGHFRETQEKVARATADLAAARKDLETREKRLGTEAELQHVFVDARRLKEIAREVVRLQKEIGKYEQDVTALENELKTARERETAVLTVLDEARAEQSALEQAHKAHALRADLVPGEPCPVCEQTVKTAPRTKKPAALASAAAAVERTEAEHQDARRALSAAEKEVDRSKTLLEVSTKSLEKEQQAFVELDALVQKALGKAKDPVAEVEERLVQIRAAKETIDEKSAGFEAARRELDEALSAQQVFSTKRRRLAAGLVEISAKFDLEAPEIDAPGDKLESHAADLRAAVEVVIEKAKDSLSEAREARETCAAQLVELHESLGISGDDTIPDALADAKTKAAVAAQEAERLEQVIERAKQLGDLEREVDHKLKIFTQLADDMRNERFINFLLEDRRMLLSELGSERLREMTGRYRFDDKGEFNVVDELDADKVREVDTLSGGEIFLASLALALALAEAVSRHGGRMQCFFIDEGFGSLDAEALDLALDGIEKIAGPDRLIGLVSHVAELGRRIEDKIVLEKSPDATTIVVSGAA